MIPFVMISCDRGEYSYLEQSIESVIDAGFSTKLVMLFFDGEKSPLEYVRGMEDYWKAEIRESLVRTGPTTAFRLAIANTLDWINFYGWEVNRFCVFQDDILVAKGLHKWLIDNPPPEGVVSLYTASPHDSTDGWNQIDMDPSDANPHPWMHSLGACAYLLTVDIAKKLLELPPPVRTDRLGSWIGEFCYHNQIPYWCHSPSLVQHVGEHSVRGGIPMNAERQAKRFCENVLELRAQ